MSDIEREKRAHMQTLAERDAIQNLFDELYEAFFGDGPEYSSLFNATDAFNEMDARLSQLKALQVWQPIETAPKDGTLILLANSAQSAPGKWAQGNWRAMYFVQREDVRDFGAGAGLFNAVTRWRPFPAPPQSVPSSEDAK